MPEAETIDQAAQVADFEYVSQDVDEAEGAPAPAQPEKGKPNAQPAAGQPAPGTKPEQPGSETQKPDVEQPDFLKEFYSEDGTVDLNRFAQNFRPNAEPPKLDNFVRPEVTGPKPVDTKADWEKFVGERETYEKGVRDNLGLMGQLINRHIAEMYPGDANVAAFVRNLFAAVNPQLDNIIRQDLGRWEAEARAKAEDSRIKREQDRYEMAQTAPQSASNHAVVAAEFRMTKDKLESVLFDPKFGGQDIMYLFKVSNPEDAKKTGDDLKAALNTWYTRFTANRDNLRYLAERAQSRVHQHLWPQVIKRIRSGDETQRADIKAAGVKSPGQRQQTQRPNQNPLETYLNRRAGAKVDEIG